MNMMLDILPCYNETSSVITLVISSPTQAPIRDEELADILREYALYLEYVQEEETKN